MTDEYIRLLDCNHMYHRVCLIRNLAEMTNKRFFLTRREQKSIPSKPLSLCPDCKTNSLSHCKGYRKHIVFDLLKDKADLFYSKMLERKLAEEAALQEDDQETEILSQDSENYNEDYKHMIQNIN